jgi:hypothetical protein
MVGACSMSGRGKSHVQGFGGETLEKETVAITKTFGLGFKHIKVNVQNLIFLYIIHVVWLFYITYN